MNIQTKSYESLLPFLVVEAITAQNVSFQSMSVRMMEKGWAWLVSSRKLLVWRFKESKSLTVSTRSRRTLSPCFELQLPQTDLIHKAELINVFFVPQNPNTSLRTVTVPAAVSVSPEGIIRFWSSIANERFTESTAMDMQGQEFCTLTSLSPLEYLLGTTTGSVYLLTIDTNSSDQRGLIVCSSLAAPSGLLSGISRRMTNLFFGPLNTDSGSSRRPLITAARISEKIGAPQLNDRTFFVLTSSFKLRQWSRRSEGPSSHNEVIREWDLHKKILEKLSTALSVNDSQLLSFWPVDMVSTRSKELLMLVVTLDATRNNTINYVTIVFNPYQSGDRISKTTVLRSHSWQYTNESEEQLLALRFIERCASSPVCFMYDRKFLFLAQVDNDIMDAIDYANQDDSILGAGFVDNKPLLFTQRDGLITSTAVRRQQEDNHDDDSNMTRNNSSMNTTRPFVSETIHEETHLTTITDEESSELHQSQSVPSQADRQKETSSARVNRSDKENKSESDFLSSKEFEWLEHISNKRYGQASDILSRLAEESEMLQDRRTTLLALSKLARLAE